MFTSFCRKVSLVVLYSTYTVVSIFSFFVQPTYTNAEDLLEKAFFPARQQETVINMGNTKRAVGNEILREGVTVNLSLFNGINAGFGQGCFDNQKNRITFSDAQQKSYCENTLRCDWNIPITQGGGLQNFGQGCFCATQRQDVEQKLCESAGYDWNIPVIDTSAKVVDANVTQRAPWIVRFSKFLLRATMVLAIIMIIVNGIKYILALGDESKTGEVRDSIKNIIIGILVALCSLAIVNLINSITLSTITENPTPSSVSTNTTTTTSGPRTR